MVSDLETLDGLIYLRNRLRDEQATSPGCRGLVAKNSVLGTCRLLVAKGCLVQDLAGSRLRGCYVSIASF